MVDSGTTCDKKTVRSRSRAATTNPHQCSQCGGGGGGEQTNKQTKAQRDAVEEVLHKVMSCTEKKHAHKKKKKKKILHVWGGWLATCAPPRPHPHPHPHPHLISLRQRDQNEISHSPLSLRSQNYSGQGSVRPRYCTELYCTVWYIYDPPFLSFPHYFTMPRRSGKVIGLHEKQYTYCNVHKYCT